MLDTLLPVQHEVNISARQLQQLDFFVRLQTLLTHHPGIEPARLWL